MMDTLRMALRFPQAGNEKKGLEQMDLKEKLKDIEKASEKAVKGYIDQTESAAEEKLHLDQFTPAEGESPADLIHGIQDAAEEMLNLDQFTPPEGGSPAELVREIGEAADQMLGLDGGHGKTSGKE